MGFQLCPPSRPPQPPMAVSPATRPLSAEPTASWVRPSHSSLGFSPRCYECPPSLGPTVYISSALCENVSFRSGFPHFTAGEGEAQRGNHSWSHGLLVPRTSIEADGRTSGRKQTKIWLPIAELGHPCGQLTIKGSCPSIQASKLNPSAGSTTFPRLDLTSLHPQAPEGPQPAALGTPLGRHWPR